MNQPVKPKERLLPLTIALGLLLPASSQAFVSGSSGALGDFSPQVSTEVILPEDGILNYTTVNIPTGVTVTFKKNTTNTPIVMLASGDVIIAGSINVSAGSVPASGAAGGGNIGDDGQPGQGGPGGYDGGRGGLVGSTPRGGMGLGPGGGGAGLITINGYGNGGGSAGYITEGNTGGACYNWGPTSSYCNDGNGAAGVSYGSASILPLIGGSGGGGGAAGTTFGGSGGGGGGGAILIASSGTVNVTGSILANGSQGGDSAGANSGGVGGSGSGGAIRIVATTISGNGTISAAGATYLNGASPSYTRGTAAAHGRIRLEAEFITRTASTSPAFSSAAPGPVFISGLPSLRISAVAGVSAPASPTGSGDITLPADTPNPVTVEFQVTGVPDGNTVQLTVTPAYSAPITATSPAINLGVASVDVNLPSGASTLSASTTYTIVASLGDALSTYAMGERVEKLRLNAELNGPSTLTLITVSGKEYTIPSQLAAGILANS